jgi:hypothetical protein
MQVGTYSAGPPKSNGDWESVLPEVKIDAGNFYASKVGHINDINTPRSAATKFPLPPTIVSTHNDHCSCLEGLF